MKKDKLLILMAGFYLASQVPAHAYLDPGTGSMVIQVLIASLAAAGLFVKNFWIQIKTFFTGKKTMENKDEME